MNFFTAFEERVRVELAAMTDEGLLPADLDLSRISVEPPRDPSHGDVATNAALVLSKAAKKSPREIADRLAKGLEADASVLSAEVAGPGFINLRLTDSFWHSQILEILAAGVDYGSSEQGAGEKLNVEYVSVNPTGPLHVGHARVAVVGDALAALLEKAGYDVTREYYYNDTGGQIDALARSVYMRYRELLGEDIGEIPEGHYRGDYIIDVARSVVEQDGEQWLDQNETGWPEAFKEYIEADRTEPWPSLGPESGVQIGNRMYRSAAAAAYDMYLEMIGVSGKRVPDLWLSAKGYRVRSTDHPSSYFILNGIGESELRAAAEAAKVKDGDRWVEQANVGWLEAFRKKSVAAMMETVQEDLELLGVRQDVYFSEGDLHRGGAIAEAVKKLDEKGYIYRGVLDPPKGKVIEDWEPREQILFRATEFGDDVDRPLQKSDESWTYFAADIAYHVDKLERGFKHMINVWGADHGGHVKRLSAAVSALSNGEAEIDVRLCQMVRLLRDGKLVKMSKRAGDYVTLREVIAEVGRDVVRFIMLTRKNDAQLDFDFSAVVEQSKDNPVFYVQYAHARCQSVLRNAAAELPGVADELEKLDLDGLAGLEAPEEIALIRRLASWPRLVESAAAAHEPHRIAFFLQEIAAEFHGLWNRGNEDEQLRFIRPLDRDLTRARLALVTSVAMVIASGLAVMGVEPLDEMR